MAALVELARQGTLRAAADVLHLSEQGVRNRLIALPYKLMLPLLARRIAFAALRVSDADFALAASCERQSLPQFFGVARAR